MVFSNYITRARLPLHHRTTNTSHFKNISSTYTSARTHTHARAHTHLYKRSNRSIKYCCFYETILHACVRCRYLRSLIFTQHSRLQILLFFFCTYGFFFFFFASFNTRMYYAIHWKLNRKLRHTPTRRRWRGEKAPVTSAALIFVIIFCLRGWAINVTHNSGEKNVQMMIYLTVFTSTAQANISQNRRIIETRNRQLKSTLYRH